MIKMEEMKGGHLRAAKQLDMDYSSPPWNNQTWKKQWTDNKEAFGTVVKQLNIQDKMWYLVGYALVVQTKEGYKITKLVIKDSELYEAVGSKLLHSFVGKVIIWVRARNVKLCKLLTKNGYKLLKSKENIYKNPADDGYLFQKCIEKLSISPTKEIEETSEMDDL